MHFEETFSDVVNRKNWKRGKSKKFTRLRRLRLKLSAIPHILPGLSSQCNANPSLPKKTSSAVEKYSK